MRLGRVVILFFALAFWFSQNAEAAKQIQFSGYQWEVKEGESLQPGPNDWAKENVWVDENGELHLKLSFKDGKWHSAQVTSTKSLGYGTYEFYVKGRIDQFDPMSFLVCIHMTQAQLETIIRKSTSNSLNGETQAVS